jgi:choline dehydrogenase-like flavoprotein
MEHLGVEVGTIRLASSARCSAAEIEERVSWQLYDELKKEKLGGAILEFMYMPKESAIRVGAVIEMKPRATNRVTLSSTSRDVHGAPAAQLSIALTEDEPKAWRRVQAAGRRVADKLTGARFVAGPPEAGWCHHHMGACRMGLNPATSVVNRDLRLHEVDNLYVAGSASFVTGGVGSPTLLLTALSIRLADHLASRIRLPQ